MTIKNNGPLSKIKWHKVFGIISATGFFFFVLHTILINSKFLDRSAMCVTLLAALVGLFGVLYMLYFLNRHIETSLRQMSKLSDLFNKSHEMLNEINHNSKLTETTKSIAYRDVDRLTLGEAILSKLHQKDFNSTYNMIEAVEAKTEYKELADKLKTAADKYKNASEEERIDQAIKHIEGLAKDQHWSQAYSQAAKLQKFFPESNRTQELPEKLRQMKEEKKKQLLLEWESATKTGNTEQSLTILQELDKYLTPSEGLALQESVSDVFRAKLQSLGVRFSLAVSEKSWETALSAGEEIIKYFPNSRMAHEILEKIDVLRAKVNQDKE